MQKRAETHALTLPPAKQALARGDDMVRRFGLETLADAVNRIKYPGLDLSNVVWTMPGTEKAQA
jgi:hypothetical protein